MAAAVGEPLLFADMNSQEEPSHVLNGNQEELLSNLMAKLKTTSEQIKTWSDTSRKIKSVMAKCEESNSVDANRLQHCLDQLKMAIKSSMTLPAMVERLKLHARRAGMKFNTGHSPREVFISSDIFYVEVMLENSGYVEDVKIFRQDEAESCPAMRDCLRKSNFNGFLDHLKGLNSFHQLPCEIAMKRDAFKCLQTLEEDVKKLFEMSCLSTTNVLVLILSGLAGFVTPRIGGYPMRLTFFVSPYDLLNVEKKTSTVLNMSDPLPEGIGLSLNVLLEGSHNRKLQSRGTLYNSAHAEGNKGALNYNFVALNNSNCLNIPACFVLQLNKPMPVSTSLIKRLAISQIHGISLSSAAPLNSLICRHAQDPVLPADTRLTPQNKFYVTLPGEQHCYFISECNKDMKGVIVSTIPVTCTSQAIAIVTALRQQAVYNTLIASCVRSDTCKDESILFEVTTISQYKLTIAFEHPAKIGMACVELDMSEVTNVKCIIHTPEGEEPLCSNEYATKVLQKCMSIPVTMRAIMKVANANIEKFRKPLSSSAAPGKFSPGSGNSQNPGKGNDDRVSPKHGSTTMNYMSSGRMGGGTSRKSSNSIIFDLSNSVATFFAPKNVGPHVPERTKSTEESKKSQNPMLAELLTSCTVSGSSSNKSNANPVPVTSDRSHQTKQDQTTVPTLKRKIRSTSDSKSPKQVGDIDDAVFLPQNNYMRQMSTPGMSSRGLSVSDMSAIMLPVSSGFDTNQPFSGHDAFVTSPGLGSDSGKRLKRSESFDDQSWNIPSAEAATHWKGHDFDGFHPDNQSKNNVGEHTLLDLPDHAKHIADDLPENVFSTSNFPNADFPDLDPDDVNLLDEAVEFGKSEMNKDLSASYPHMGSSGKPPLIVSRCQSADGVVKKTEVNEKTLQYVPDVTPVKQPHPKSKGKPKNFKPDLEDSSLSSDTSPSPPKKIKKKGKKREGSSHVASLEHSKKLKKKRRIEDEEEPQSTGNFTLTASSSGLLKIKFSRTGSEPKKQVPPEPKKSIQTPASVKPITLRINPGTGETSSLKAGQPQPKRDPDKRGNVFEVFGSKTSIKSPNLEKRKVLQSEQFSKSIGGKYEGKQSSMLNKKVVTQKVISRDSLTGQSISMHSNDKMQSVLKKVNVKKITTSTAVNKALLAKKTKFGSSKTSSKTVTPGQMSPSVTNLSTITGKVSSGAGSDVRNKTTLSGIKTTTAVNVSKHVSGTKVSKPPPLTISPSISSTASPSTASPRQVTTPLSPTGPAGQKKNNKSPFRARTLTSIVQVLQMKAQTQTPEDELNEVTEEVNKQVEVVARPRSISLEGDNKTNLLHKVPPVVKAQKKVGTVMPLKSPTFSGSNKSTTNPKSNSSTKVFPATGKPASTSSPKQSKVPQNLSRSLSTPASSNKVSTVTSVKGQPRLHCPGKPLQSGRPLQKSFSSPVKPAVKTAGSPTTLPRKPNILSKSPKLAGSPKHLNVSVPGKVASPQSAMPQQVRHNIAKEVSKKQPTSVRTSNNTNTNIRTSTTTSNSNNMKNVPATTSDVIKTETQVTKKINPCEVSAKLTNDSKNIIVTKNKDEIPDNKITIKDMPQEKLIPPYSKGIHESMPKTVISQKAHGKIDIKEAVGREATSSPVTHFKVPSPAVVPIQKTASPKPVTTLLATGKTPEIKVVTETSSKLIPSANKLQATTKEMTDLVNKVEDKMVQNLKKRRKPLSPGDALSESKPLFIDDPQDSVNVSSPDDQREASQPDNPSSDTQTEPGSTSPRSMIVQSPLGIMACSPLGQVASPLMLPAKSPAALSCPSNQASPCPIDDDLMDEALISVISKEDN